MAEGRARESLRVSPEDRARVDALCSSLRRHSQAAAAASSSSPSFFEGLALRGIRVLRIRPGFIHCSFTVPNTLTVGAFPFIHSPIFYYYTLHSDSSHQDSSTHGLLTNAATAKVVAEGRHSLFGNMKKSTPPPPPHRSNM